MSTIQMVTDDATPHVMRAFKMTGAQQMFRELPVNSAQAGASRLLMGTAWSIVAETGTHYATFEDDGEGMTAEQMPDFLNKFGGSGRTIGYEDDNFGIGFKTSAIPDNRKGIVVLSLRDGIESMMWLWFDPHTDKVGARVLCTPDLLGDDHLDAVSESGSPSVLVLDSDDGGWEHVEIDGIDWTKVLPQWIKDAGHGTCFVMLGNDGSDTIGRVGGLTQKYGPTKEVTRRFWTLPLDSIEQVSYPNFTNRSLWPGVSGGLDANRKAIGAGEFIVESAIDMGEVEINAGGMSVNVTWALMNEDPNREQGAQRGDMISWPATAAIYESHPGIEELMDLKSGGEARDRIDQFVGPHAVAKRCMIFVRPPGDQVWQDGTRTVLRWREGEGLPKALPWAAWAREFRSNLPEPLAELVRAHYADITEAADDLTDEDYQRLGSRFGALLRRTVLVLRPDSNGRQRAGEQRDGAAGPARRGPRRRRREGGGETNTDTATPGNNIPASNTRRTEDLPKAIFDESEFAGRPHLAAHYDAASHTVIVNPDHLYIAALDLAIRQKYVDESQERQDWAVKGGRRAVKTHASLCVAHQLQLCATTPEMHDEFMSDVALTAAFGGVRNLMDAASGYIGDLTRRAA